MRQPSSTGYRSVIHEAAPVWWARTLHWHLGHFWQMRGCEFWELRVGVPGFPMVRIRDQHVHP